MEDNRILSYEVKDDAFTWKLFATLYYKENAYFWSSLKEIVNVEMLPWLVIGDLNKAIHN